VDYFLKHIPAMELAGSLKRGLRLLNCGGKRIAIVGFMRWLLSHLFRLPSMLCTRVPVIYAEQSFLAVFAKMHAE